MTLVGVISDTHGSLHEQAYAALADCDHIIHAGDIGGPHILRELETLAPVTAVLGNNDFSEYGYRAQRFAHPVIEGVKFLVAHFPHDVEITAFGGPGLAPGDPIPDLCIHGHTHVPRLDYGAAARPASYILNPGSASWPRGGHQRSIAKISIVDSRIEYIRIETLRGKEIMSLNMAH